MISKTLDYWRKQLANSPSADVVADLQQTLKQKDTESLACAFIAVVEAMSLSDKRKVMSKLMQIAKHFHLLGYFPPDSESFRRDEAHWNNEIEEDRTQIQITLLAEPSLIPELPNLLAKVQDLARREAGRKLNLPETEWKWWPDLSLDLIYPPNLIPGKIMPHKTKQKG